MDMKNLYKKQISFTEWFEKINHEKTQEMRSEDNSKRERLEILNQFIHIPFDKATKFEAVELNERSERFQRFLKEHGHELCALRLVPKDDQLPKLRMRGHTIKSVMVWYNEQTIDPSKYRADFVPHTEQTLFSTIFVINNQGIFGEIIRGGHHLLTQGFYDQEKPICFSYDFTTWNCSDEEVLNHLKGILKKLKVDDQSTKQILAKKLAATFAGPYLCGYFETVFTLENGLWFIDYNRILGEMINGFKVSSNMLGDLQGMSACEGKVQGKVRIINSIDEEFNTGDVLVCNMTSPDFVPLMQKASAIITDKGGVLSHAAIVARELGKPCIVGTNNATSLLNDGDLVEVDGNKGVVWKL
jgi:phosphohistidine swiveling domain-containing protein